MDQINSTEKVNINSNEELYQALSTAMQGMIVKTSDTYNPMTLMVRDNYHVTIYADNHGIPVIIHHGNKTTQKHYQNYTQIYNTLLVMENAIFSKCISDRTNDEKITKTNKVLMFIFVILGMAIFLFGGTFFSICMASAITDSFQPIHVHLSLLFSFGVIMFAGILTIYIALRKNGKLKRFVSNSEPQTISDAK